MTAPTDPSSNEALIKLNAELDRKVFDLQALLKAGDALHHELEVDGLCRLLIAMVKERATVHQLAVLVLEEGAQILRVEAISGLPESCMGLRVEIKDGILWRLVRSGAPFSVAELDGTPRFERIFSPAGLNALQGRLWIPLVLPTRPVGVLSVGVRDDGRPIPETDFGFLQALAVQTAVALNTAILVQGIAQARQDLGRSLHRLSLLLDVSRALNAVSDLTGLLQLILERAIAASEAEKGSLMLLDEATDELVIHVVYGLPDQDLERQINDGEVSCRRFKRGDGVAGRVFETGQAIRVNNASKDGDFEKHEDSFVQSLFCVPLNVNHDTIGVINISNKIPGPDGEPAQFSDDDAAMLGALADQAAVAIARARLYQAAITDSLTKLCVRRFGWHRFSQEIRRAQRYETSLSVIMCDIDHFKSVNDLHGHGVGDDVIILVAGVLRSGIRVDVDVAIRYGGEEFLIVLPETPLAGAQAAAERMRLHVRNASTELADGTRVSVTMSFGVTAMDHENKDTIDTLLKRVDAALYDAKHAGRDQVRTR